MFAENDIAKTGERCYNIKEFGYEIQNVLITHAHQDHYVPISSYLRGDCFAHNKAESHEKIEKLLEGTDIDVAYDGYELGF